MCACADYIEHPLSGKRAECCDFPNHPAYHAHGLGVTAKEMFGTATGRLYRMGR